MRLTRKLHLQHKIPCTCWLAVGTTVKLAHALWIVPLTLLLARVWAPDEGRAGPAKRPWFILGFLAVAALVTFVPALRELGRSVALGARQALVK